MVGLPDLILESYRRYKERQEVVVNWMVDEAGDFETDHQLPLVRLGPLAQLFVAQRSPPSKVPAPIIRSLHQTILLRKRCASWYLAQASVDPFLHQSNQTHQYPIRVLGDGELFSFARRSL